jgi:hypothetical protein
MNLDFISNTTDLVFFSLASVITASIALKPRSVLTAIFGRHAMTKVSRDRERVLQGLATFLTMTIGLALLAHFLS